MNEIGIKLADGTFYPILSDDARSKELELTTVRDNQETVQIDLFRKRESLEYIGSLIVEDISQKKAGDSTIRLKLEIDNDDNLKAEAVDMDSSARQALKVSLAAVDTHTDTVDFNINDFDLGIGSESSETTVTDIDDSEKKGFPKWLIVLLVLLGIALLTLAVLLLTRSCSQKTPVTAKIKNEVTSPATTSKVPVPADDEKNKVKTDSAQNTTATTEVKKDDTKTVDTTQPTTNTTDTSTTSNTGSTDKTDKTTETTKTTDQTTKSTDQTSTVQTNADGSVHYLLKWGDTLWDLAQTFYKNPWDYGVIAKYNHIKDPNYIIAGTYIDIPKR